MSKLVLNLAIDVSGTPKGEIYVGLVSIKTDDFNTVRKQFQKNLPEIYKHSKKGTRLKANELKKVIEFLDKNYVYMYVCHITKSDWYFYTNRYKNKSNLFERVYALAYFGLIHSWVFKYHPQNLVVCKESYLDIHLTLKYFQYLAKSNNYTILSNVGYADSNFLIKLADLVASATRKVDKAELVRFEKLKILKFKDLDHKFVDRIFQK